MAGELVIPILPCRDLDESVAFYEVLGFQCTYRQRRPNPYAVVAREDMQVHLTGIDGFDPEGSYGSAIVVVPSADAFYADLSARLRGAYGKLPSVGIPRILRPRKRHGTVRGFSVVDPGGNWLRVSSADEGKTPQRTNARQDWNGSSRTQPGSPTHAETTKPGSSCWRVASIGTRRRRPLYGSTH